MSKHFDRQLVADQAIVHESLQAAGRPTRETDRTFELPPIAYKATVGLYLGFLAVMFAGFGNPGLAIPMAIFALFIVAGFGLPMIWTKMQPENRSKPLTWGKFANEGIATLTGRLSAGEAMAQVLVLPVLIVCWGLVVVVIAALV